MTSLLAVPKTGDDPLSASSFDDIASVVSEVTPARASPAILPPPDQAGGVYLSSDDVVNLVNLLTDAADALEQRAASDGGAKPLTDAEATTHQDLLQQAATLSQRMGTSAATPGLSGFLLHSSGVSLPPTAYKQGFRLNQAVEVRYVVDGEERWEKVKITKGSGGGQYSVLFPDGEIWDGIPPEDLRKPALLARQGAGGEDAGDTNLLRPSNWSLGAPVKQLMFSGWCTMTMLSVWRRRSAPKWIMLIGTTLYAHHTMLTEAWDSFELRGVKIEQSGAQRKLSLWNDPAGYAMDLAFGNEYEWRVWAAQIAAAAVRAEDEPQPDRIAEIENSVSGLLLRPVLPVLSTGKLPEEQMPATLHGYIVTANSHTVIGGHNWARRYVTLHRNCLIVRPDKKSSANIEVLPLRELACWKHPIAGHDETFELSGKFVPKQLFCFDTLDSFDKWYTAVCAAVFASNPEDAFTDKLKQQSCEEKGRGAS